MKIVTCLKQILDPNIIEFDINKNSLTSAPAILNPPDFHALEEALRIRAKYGGEIKAVSVAPQQAAGVLRKALIYGADRAVRAWDPLLEEADTWVISSVLQNIIEKESFDLILCGCKSKDTAGQVMGVALASRLNLPLVTGVVGIDIEKNNSCIVHKKLEKGKRETCSFMLPAVLTLDESIANPRYVAMFSRIYNQGIHKNIEVIELNPEKIDDDPLIERSHICQTKPRVKVGKKVSGLSMMSLMKVLRGETEGKKELFSGSALEGAEKISEKIEEWYL